MADWKQKIYDEIEKHNNRRVEVNTALTSLLEDLKNSAPKPVNLRAELHDEENLIWKVSINHKNFQFNSGELSGWQQNGTGEEMDLKEALQELLVSKMRS